MIFKELEYLRSQFVRAKIYRAPRTIQSGCNRSLTLSKFFSIIFILIILIYLTKKNQQSSIFNKATSHKRFLLSEKIIHGKLTRKPGNIVNSFEKWVRSLHSQLTRVCETSPLTFFKSIEQSSNS